VGKGKTLSFYSGNWANGGKGLQNRYVRVRFAIKNTTHYGWVRVSVSKWPFSATLTATPTKPFPTILTGKTKGLDVVTVQPDMTSFSLGKLALGRRYPPSRTPLVLAATAQRVPVGRVDRSQRTRKAGPPQLINRCRDRAADPCGGENSVRHGGLEWCGTRVPSGRIGNNRRDCRHERPHSRAKAARILLR
jgi:hypothetical protein